MFIQFQVKLVFDAIAPVVGLSVEAGAVKPSHGVRPWMTTTASCACMRVLMCCTGVGCACVCVFFLILIEVFTWMFLRRSSITV